MIVDWQSIKIGEPLFKLHSFPHISCEKEDQHIQRDKAECLRYFFISRDKKITELPAISGLFRSQQSIL